MIQVQQYLIIIEDRYHIDCMPGTYCCGLNVNRPPLTCVFEHSFQADGSVWEGCGSFRSFAQQTISLRWSWDFIVPPPFPAHSLSPNGRHREAVHDACLTVMDSIPSNCDPPSQRTLCFLKLFLVMYSIPAKSKVANTFVSVHLTFPSLLLLLVVSFCRWETLRLKNLPWFHKRVFQIRFVPIHTLAVFHNHFFFHISRLPFRHSWHLGPCVTLSLLGQSCFGAVLVKGCEIPGRGAWRQSSYIQEVCEGALWCQHPGKCHRARGWSTAELRHLYGAPGSSEV